MSSNIEVKLDVLNQKASPALYAAPLADRPAASFTGRLFVDSNSPSTGLYRDTGSTWVQIADAGAGTTGTLQQVTTNGNSTNVGITVSANGIGIGTTSPNTNRLDIHAASGIQATFNGTGTANSSLQLQSAGVAKWNVTNKYNAAANDFTITDVLNTVDRLTIKNTGLATYIGFLNVANIASAQNIQISGTAPAYTIIQGTTNENTASIGVASIANNFINGSVAGDFCLVSQSTAAKRLLLGVQSANDAAICISASNNTLIGTTTDGGQKLQVNGGSRTTGYYLNGMTGGSGALYWVNDGIDRITLANYNTGGELNFEVNGGNQVMLLNASGYLGIGITTPVTPLHVNGGTATPSLSSDGGIFTLASSTSVQLQMGAIGSSPFSFWMQVKQSTNSGSSFPLALQPTGGNLLIGTTTNGNSKLRIVGLPTSSSGLSSGDVYSNLGILTIVP